MAAPEHVVAPYARDRPYVEVAAGETVDPVEPFAAHVDLPGLLR